MREGKKIKRGGELGFEKNATNIRVAGNFAKSFANFVLETRAQTVNFWFREGNSTNFIADRCKHMRHFE